MLLSLLLAASRASGEFLVKATAAEHVNDLIGVPAAVKLTLEGNFVCPAGETPIALVYPDLLYDNIKISHTADDPSPLVPCGSTNGISVVQHLSDYIYFGIRNGSQVFTTKVDYLVKSIDKKNVDPRIYAAVCCSTCDSKTHVVNLESELFTRYINSSDIEVSTSF